MRDPLGNKARLSHILESTELILKFVEGATFDDFMSNKMIGMRNILIHKYFGMDEIVIWKTIEEDLPVLKTQIETILQAHD